MKKYFRHIALFGVIFALAAVHFLLTLIVVMFVSSSLHILNNNFFHFKNFTLVSGFVVAVMFILSSVFFFKFFRKTYRYLQNIMIKDTTP